MAAALAVVLTPVILLFLLPVMLLALEPAILRIWSPEQHTVTPLWNGFTYLGIEFAKIAGGLALLVLVVAGWPRGPWSFRLPRVLRRHRWARAGRLRPGGGLRRDGRLVSQRGTGLGRSGVHAGGATAGHRHPISRFARIFVSMESTPDQLNLIKAATRRALSGAGVFYRDSLSRSSGGHTAVTAVCRRRWAGRCPGSSGSSWAARGFPGAGRRGRNMPGLVGVRSPRDDPYQWTSSSTRRSSSAAGSSASPMWTGLARRIVLRGATSQRKRSPCFISGRGAVALAGRLPAVSARRGRPPCRRPDRAPAAGRRAGGCGPARKSSRWQ